GSDEPSATQRYDTLRPIGGSGIHPHSSRSVVPRHSSGRLLFLPPQLVSSSKAKHSLFAFASRQEEVNDGLLGPVMCASLLSMKMTKRVRTLEEICALEDRYPLIGSSPAGLMRRA